MKEGATMIKLYARQIPPEQQESPLEVILYRFVGFNQVPVYEQAV